MLLNFDDIIKKNNLDIEGVIHIGAHHGQELEKYVNMGIKNFLFFEPLPDNYMKLNDNIQNYNTEGLNIHIENVALGHRDEEKTMYVETANRGMSCSLLKPKMHLELYPHITFDSEVKVNQTFLDKYVLENNIDLDMFNFINIDVQGYELEVFKGAMETLTEIDYIYTEVNTDEIYEDCTKIEQLDEFLGNLYNFERVETKFIGGKGAGTWGDALYVKK
tara:strand:+ start:166 stop:822 length:657 start_codon:yes stop_codon:yes gene_type:complete